MLSPGEWRSFEVVINHLVRLKGSKQNHDHHHITKWLIMRTVNISAHPVQHVTLSGRILVFHSFNVLLMLWYCYIAKIVKAVIVVWYIWSCSLKYLFWEIKHKFWEIFRGQAPLSIYTSKQNKQMVHWMFCTKNKNREERGHSPSTKGWIVGPPPPKTKCCSGCWQCLEDV